MLCSEGSRIYSWTMWTDVKQNGMSNKEIKKFKCVLSRIKMNQDLETVGLRVSVWCIGLVSVKWLMCIWLGMKSGPVKSKMKKKMSKLIPNIESASSFTPTLTYRMPDLAEFCPLWKLGHFTATYGQFFEKVAKMKCLKSFFSTNTISRGYSYASTVKISLR